MAIEKLKTIKDRRTDTDQTIDTIQTTRTYVFKILNTTSSMCVGKIVNLHGFK